MRHLVVAAILSVGCGACARAYLEATPSSARLVVNGRIVGVGEATIPTRRGKVVLVRAEQEGFRPACAIVEYRQDTVLRLARATSGDAPLPSDDEILHAWNDERTDLCAIHAESAPPSRVVVSAGDLDRPYEVLGEVQLDANESTDDTAAAYEALRGVAVARYGEQVDAVVNAHVSEVDGDGFVRGTAVHFVAGEAAVNRSTAERLDELDRLRAAGLITAEEYRSRRKAILKDL